MAIHVKKSLTRAALQVRRFLVPMILPIAVGWIEKQERRILATGTPLNDQQLADARAAGVKKAHQVRLLRVESVPFLRPPMLHALGLKLGLLSPHTVGLTARYGIFIREDFWGHRLLLIHEFAHTAQYERLGGLRPFLRMYLRECLVAGYPNGPLETEAAATACQICRGS